MAESGERTGSYNHLIHEKSPYLLQHARNPVDWYPWREEALQKARQEDKPIFLSIGYATCHWCHVMAHESFEDPEVAHLLNQFFVSIKVDREERPDIDQIYMSVCQALTGQGGWPLSIFMTPGREPFLCRDLFSQVQPDGHGWFYRPSEKNRESLENGPGKNPAGKRRDSPGHTERGSRKGFWACFRSGDSKKRFPAVWEGLRRDLGRFRGGSEIPYPPSSYLPSEMVPSQQRFRGGQNGGKNVGGHAPGRDL